MRSTIAVNAGLNKGFQNAVSLMLNNRLGELSE
jgi:hypothetical protein